MMMFRIFRVTVMLRFDALEMMMMLKLRLLVLLYVEGVIFSIIVGGVTRVHSAPCVALVGPCGLTRVGASVTRGKGRILRVCGTMVSLTLASISFCTSRVIIAMSCTVVTACYIGCLDFVFPLVKVWILIREDVVWGVLLLQFCVSPVALLGWPNYIHTNSAVIDSEHFTV